MAEHKKRVGFYLAGVDESGGNLDIHRKMAKVAEAEGARVLNKHRTYPRTFLKMIEDGGLLGELEESMKTVPQANAFGAYYGLRSFPSGYELGRLFDKVGVIFTEQKKFAIPSGLIGEQTKVVYLPDKEDDELIQQEVKDITALARKLSGNNSNKWTTGAISKKQLQQMINAGIIRTGALTFDLQRRRVLNEAEELELSDVQFQLAALLAENMSQIVSDEQFEKNAKEKLDIDQHIVNAAVRNTVYKINRCSPDDTRYIETIFGRGYKLRAFKPIQVPEPTIMKYGDLEIDISNRRSWKDGQKLLFGGVGMNFLITLAEARSEPLSKEDLIDIIWPNSDATPETLRYLIARVRKVIGDTGPNYHYIQNIDGSYLLSGNSPT